MLNPDTRVEAYKIITDGIPVAIAELEGRVARLRSLLGNYERPVFTDCVERELTGAERAMIFELGAMLLMNAVGYGPAAREVAGVAMKYYGNPTAEDLLPRFTDVLVDVHNLGVTPPGSCDVFNRSATETGGHATGLLVSESTEVYSCPHCCDYWLQGSLAPCNCPDLADVLTLADARMRKTAKDCKVKP